MKKYVMACELPSPVEGKLNTYIDFMITWANEKGLKGDKIESIEVKQGPYGIHSHAIITDVRFEGKKA